MLILNIRCIASFLQVYAIFKYMKRKKPGPHKGTKHSDVKRSAFGERLFKARKARDLTQLQLANKLGLSRRMIAYYESDTEGPTVRGLEEIARVLNVTAAYLLGESTQKSIEVDIPQSLRKQIETLKGLPAKDQKIVVGMIDSLSEKTEVQHQRAETK